MYWPTRTVLVLSSFVLSSAFVGCSRDGDETAEAPRDDASPTASASGDTAEGRPSMARGPVLSPPVTEARLREFLRCEPEMLALTQGRWLETGQALEGTAMGERVQRMEKAGTEGEAMREAVGGLARAGAESQELGETLAAEVAATEAAQEEKARTCGFASHAEWQSFQLRVTRLRQWRLQQQTVADAAQRVEQLRASLDERVAAGQMSEADRDALLARMPAADPVAAPELEPAVTDEEIAAIEAVDLDTLMHQQLRRR